MSLYANLMGAGFERLHSALRRFHSLQGTCMLHGEVLTLAPTGWAARWLAAALGTPRHDVAGPIRFVLEASPEAETWTRHFPGRTMRSVLRARQGHLTESLGLARLTFDLAEHAGALEMRLRAVHVLGVRCPRWLMPRVLAREHGAGTRLCFEVQADVPGLGRVAGYRGFLKVPCS